MATETKEAKKARQTSLLKHKRTYLAGPIEHVSEKDAMKWRDQATDRLHKFGVKVFDPCKSIEDNIHQQRKYITELKNARRFDALRYKMKRVVRQDLRCIDLVDFVVVYMPPGVQSTGTLHELIQADREYKPTLLVCEDLTKLPDWIFGILPTHYMFESFDLLFEYLELVDSGYIQDDMRWQFLEFE